MWFLYIVIGLLIGSLFVYVIQRPKMKTFVSLDEQTAQTNKELHIELTGLQIEIAGLANRKTEILNGIADLEKQAKEAGQKFLEQSRQLAETNFEHEAEKLASQFQEHQESVQNEYLITMQEMSQDIVKQLQAYKDELLALDNMIAEKQAIVAAAVEASKRAEQMASEKDFYRLVLSDEDIAEIGRLKEVVPYLRDSEPLNKVIWKVYYEKPYTDLIGRVVGTGTHTGIYKITNISNDMCYVGQAVNIGR